MEGTLDNILYYGNNLDILRRYFKDETVDLIYLDPPFNSDQDYNVLFAEQDGSRSASQIKAFGDTWRWDQEAARAYQETVEADGKVSQAMQAFRTFLGDNDMLAYLSNMAPRLVQLQRVLKPTGSIYLHCDPTASAYLRLLMDAVFGPEHFRNEIVWHYSGWNKKLAGKFESRSDSLLFYAKGSEREQVFPGYARRWESEEEYVKVRKQKIRTDEQSRRYVLSDGGGGKRVRRYLDEAMATGVYVDNVWHIDKLNNSSKERLGYPTQKPEALLERIVQSSSREGDVVLDPFCGCGTAIAVAQKLNRQWIGIDITHLAITLIKHRLLDAHGGRASYKVVGEPVSLPDAEALAKEDPYQFQWWALGLVGARPVDQKKGADKGIDGRLYFHDWGDEIKTHQVIFSVKGGGIKPGDVRDLGFVVQREKAAIGVLITLNEPTKQMMAEAASGGFYHSDGTGKDYPALQILTIGDLLNGKLIDMPPQKEMQVTFKRAPRARGPRPSIIKMPIEP